MFCWCSIFNSWIKRLKWPYFKLSESHHSVTKIHYVAHRLNDGEWDSMQVRRENSQNQPFLSKQILRCLRRLNCWAVGLATILRTRPMLCWYFHLKLIFQPSKMSIFAWCGDSRWQSYATNSGNARPFRSCLLTPFLDYEIGSSNWSSLSPRCNIVSSPFLAQERESSRHWKASESRKDHYFVWLMKMSIHITLKRQSKGDRMRCATESAILLVAASLDTHFKWRIG